MLHSSILYLCILYSTTIYPICKYALYCIYLNMPMYLLSYAPFLICQLDLFYSLQSIFLRTMHVYVLFYSLYSMTTYNLDSIPIYYIHIYTILNSSVLYYTPLTADTLMYSLIFCPLYIFSSLYPPVLYAPCIYSISLC
jgi:hypothetical protein